MIILLHAYSRKNKGDGLLVDESLSLIADALGPDMPVTVVSSDAESFADLPLVRQIPGPERTGAPRKIIRALGNIGVTLKGAVSGEMDLLGLNDLLPQTKAILGVGGAYLRAGHPRAAFITAAVQWPQLVWAVRSGKPTIYLPQSVGPFCPPWRALYRPELAKLNALFVRDDRSMETLRPNDNMIRCPDLALLRLGRGLNFQDGVQDYKKIYLVARDLPRPPKIRAQYIESLQKLRMLLPDMEPVVQSRGRGNDDHAFYKELGWGDCRDVGTAIAESGPGVMISVRLHGALQAMIAGCPAIHLTYERKGFGAYGDLGIMPYLRSATQFVPEKVAAQAHDIQDGAPFWSLIAKRRSSIIKSYETLKQTVQRYAQ